MTVTMTCMTFKKKFDVDRPEVVQLKNGRYAYRAQCPWEGKNGRQLFAYKFCSREAYEQGSSEPTDDAKHTNSPSAPPPGE
jgi:hypothetical protein